MINTGLEKEDISIISRDTSGGGGGLCTTEESGSGPVKITRAKRACDNCSRLKKRCEGGFPCSFCSLKDVVCTFEKVHLKRGPKRIAKVAEKSSGAMNPAALDFSALDRRVFTDHSDFMNISIDNASVFDVYFRRVYPKIPLLSRKWLQDNFQHAPLYFLHAIVASCVCHLPEMNYHLQSAFQDIYNVNIDNVDGFTVASLIHLSFASHVQKNYVSSKFQLSMAISLSRNLGFHQNIPGVFTSRLDHKSCTSLPLGLNYSRSMWLLLFIWDFNHSMVYGFENSKIPEFLNDAQFSDFVCPNSDDASNIQDHYLKRHRFTIALINFGKSIMKRNENDVDPSSSIYDVERRVYAIDLWFSKAIPIQFRFTLVQESWMGGSIVYLNLVYHLLRLKTMRICLLAILSSPVQQTVSVLDNFVVRATLESTAIFTQISTCYIQLQRGAEDRNFMLLEYCIYLAGLICCSIPKISTIRLTDYTRTHIDALSLLKSDRVAVLQSCLGDCNKAIQCIQDLDRMD